MCRFQISDSDKIDYDVVIFIYSNNDKKNLSSTCLVHLQCMFNIVSHYQLNIVFSNLTI